MKTDLEGQFAHFDIETRRALEAGLNDGIPFAKAAERIGVSVSSVSREA